MAKQGILFGNKRIYKPGVYSKTDAKGSVGRDYADQKTICLIGTSKGGEPNKLRWYDDPVVALKELKGGDLYDAVNLVYNTSPAGIGEGAGRIGVIRVNPATQSTGALGSWATLKSKDYGVWTTDISVMVKASTEIPSVKDIIVYDKSTDSTEYYKNVGAIFQVKTSQSNSYITLKDNSGHEVEVTVNSEVVGSIKLDKLPTLRRMAEWVDSISKSKVNLVMLDTVSGSVTPSDLDLAKTETNGYVTAMKAEVVNRLMDSDYVTITLDSGEPDDTEGWVTLTGGTDGETPESWKGAFDLAGSAYFSIVVPLTEQPAIIGEALAHANLMSNDKAKERIVIAGLGINTPVSDAIKTATTLGNARCQLIPQSAYVRIAGQSKLVPAYLVACLQAGRCSFIDTAESNTFSYFPIITLSKEYTEEEINSLLKAGCTLFEGTQQGVRMIQDITTYTDGEESLYTERSVIMLADTINKELRARLEDKFIGKKGVKSTPETVKNEVIAFLKEKERSEVINAYRNISVTFFNRVVTVEYEVAPVEPINFILITGHFFTESAVTV